VFFRSRARGLSASSQTQFVVPVPDSVTDGVAAQMLVNPTVLMLRREAEKLLPLATTASSSTTLPEARWADWSPRVSATTTRNISVWSGEPRSRSGYASGFEVPVVVTEDPDWVDAARDSTVAAPPG
jgi:hypothetical protein